MQYKYYFSIFNSDRKGERISTPKLPMDSVPPPRPGFSLRRRPRLYLLQLSFLHSFKRVVGLPWWGTPRAFLPPPSLTSFPLSTVVNGPSSLWCKHASSLFQSLFQSTHSLRNLHTWSAPGFYFLDGPSEFHSTFTFKRKLLSYLWPPLSGKEGAGGGGKKIGKIAPTYEEGKNVLKHLASAFFFSPSTGRETFPYYIVQTFGW